MINKKGTAIAQIFLLIIGIIAVSYAIGSQVPEVRGQAALNAATNSAPSEGSWFIDSARWVKETISGWVDLPAGISGWASLLGWASLWSAIAFAVGYTIGQLSGGAGGSTDDEFARELGYSFAGGAFIGYLGGAIILGPIGGVLLGIAVTMSFFNGLSQEFDQKIVSFECKYWQPERGGNNCELCNNQLLPCTEYQCKSLGGACKLINRNTADPICVYDDTQDVIAPEITPLESALKDGYYYEPLPANRGVEIKYKENGVTQECLPAFKPFAFGISLNKYGYCKMDDRLTSNFSEMQYDFAGMNYPILEAEQWLKFPGTAFFQSLGIEIANGGDYEYYVRCENLNGISRDAFLFKFCIDKGPDTTGPQIVRTTPLDKTPIRFFNETEPHEMPVFVYTNEPAICKWDHSNKDYTEMQNNLSCSLSGTYFNSDLNYECSGVLAGLENRKENDFYFKCNDSAGNIGGQTTKLTLIGTEELVISSVEPNATIIKGSSDNIRVPLEVKTSAGAKNGEALCSYSLTGVYNEYNIFEKSGTSIHSTDLWLNSGDHLIYIQCFDQAGNIVQTNIEFTVDKDTSPPAVVRILKESTDLKIITDEKAECVYNNQPDIGCSYNFEDGNAMTTYDNLEHITSWDSSNTYYIKCKDDFGNQPNFDQCSITARPFEF